MTKTAKPSAKTYARPVAIPVETRVPFSFVHINKCGGSSIEIALGIGKAHRTAASMRAEIGAEAWAERFTFAVVRNPFARAVSVYFYRVRTDQRGLGDRHLNVNAWVEKVWGEKDPAYGEDASILTAPSYDWVSDGTGLIVDRIARLETLAEDWRPIAETLGVNPVMARTNWNMHPPYRDLLAPSARAVLEQAFARDLEHFDYAF
ncbi:MAG: sulfotransferase family 2 domain-containing protein [Pseudomonadota bacterium]